MKESRREEWEKKVKQLETELRENEQLRESLKKRAKQLEGQIKETYNCLRQINEVVSVSDHAILRYAERRYGVPIEEIKAEIEGLMKKAPAVQALKAMGFVIQGNVIVTYLPGEGVDLKAV